MTHISLRSEARLYTVDLLSARFIRHVRSSKTSYVKAAYAKSPNVVGRPAYMMTLRHSGVAIILDPKWLPAYRMAMDGLRSSGASSVSLRENRLSLPSKTVNR